MLPFEARFIDTGLSDVSIILVCGLIAVAGSWSEEVMGNGCCAEPSLDELFGDSAMRLLMRRDGVTEGDIRALLGKLEDERAVALGGSKRGLGVAKDAAHPTHRREMTESSGAAVAPRMSSPDRNVSVFANLEMSVRWGRAAAGAELRRSAGRDRRPRHGAQNCTSFLPGGRQHARLVEKLNRP